MTENQTKFLELVALYEKAKEELSNLDRQLRTVLGQMEPNTYFQDPITNAVYKIVRPKGTFVSYKDIDYNRTAFEGEDKGSLSKKEAKEAGYLV